jgi:CheY-like chemotaxis protein
MLSSRLNVFNAMSGIESLEILKTNKHIQLILCDYDMPPGINGCETIEQIRILYPNINIFGMSASSHGLNEFEKLNIPYFVKGSFNKNQLYDKLTS